MKRLISAPLPSLFSLQAKRMLSRVAVLLAFVFVFNGLVPLAARAGEGSGAPDDMGWVDPAWANTGGNDGACGNGPSACDPVDLGKGTESYGSITDIAAYNPNGPSAAFARTFLSARAIDGYGSPGLSPGWVHPYDYTIHRTRSAAYYSGGSPGSPPTPYPWETTAMISPNGSVENLQSYTAQYYNVGYGPYLNYPYPHQSVTPSEVYVTHKDGTLWTFTIVNGGDKFATDAVYALTKITSRTGQSITLYLDGNRCLTSIVDDTSSTTLLSFAYDTNGQLSTVTDAYGRKIAYTFGTATGSGLTTDCLLEVSQIALASTSSPPAKYGFSYVGFNGQPLLHTITIPSPTGTGTATATINYDNGTGGTGKVSSLVDANGNQHVYTYGGSSTLVEVKDPANNLVLSWTQNFNSEGRKTGTTNANYQTDYIYYGDPAHPMLPTQFIGKDGRSSSVTYDSHGNMTSSTDPRGVITNYTYSYSPFWLGRLTEVQVGSKPSTTFTYYEPSGLLQTATGPSPTGTGTVTYTYTYDALGNVLTVTGPGNNATSTITTTYSYTTDGSYSQAAAIGQAIAITDNLGHTTHLRYDAQGRVTDVADAVGNTGSITYNLAGQTLTSSGPATGQTGSGHGYVQNVYQYAGGLLAATKMFDESSTQIRQVNYATDRRRRFCRWLEGQNR